MFQSALLQQTPQIFSVFLIYQVLDTILIHLPTSFLVSAKEDLNTDTRRKWSRKVLSLLHSSIVTGTAIWILPELANTNQFDTPEGRALTFIGECTILQTLMLGYELWEALAIAFHPSAFPTGTLAHCIINAVVWLVTMTPTANYYIPGFILCQSSSVFLELHWILEQAGMNFGLLARFNDAVFWLCFVGVRLGYFPIHAFRMVADGIATWNSQSRLVFPNWLVAVYVFLPVSLGVLNVFWFYRIIASGRFDLFRQQTKSKAHDAATTESNKQELKAAWASALQKEIRDINDNDDFFRIGGDSMGALQMQEAARTRGINLTPKTIVTHPTLAKMAKAATTDLGARADTVKPFACLGLLAWPARFKAASICHVKTSSVQDMYPCATFQGVQMALGANDKDRFRLRVSYHTSSDLDMPRFKKAFELLAESNPILRTRIVKIRTAFLQVVLDEKIEWHQYERMDDYLAENQNRHMTFGRPLTHYALVNHRGGKPPTFVWMVHHALFDGWSVQLLLNELSRLYEGLNPTKFHPFSQVMYDWYRRGSKSTVEYWVSELQGAVPTHFPGVSPLHSGTTNDRVTGRVSRVSATTHPHIKLATIIRSTWALVLSELMEKDDVIFGLIVSGRNSSTYNVQRTVGPTISTVPIRTRLNGQQSVEEYMTATHQQDVSMLPHEQFPIAQLRASHPQALRAFSSHSSVIIHPRGRAYRDLPGVLGKLGTVQIHRMGFSKPIVLEFFLETDRIDLCLHYDSSILERTKMEMALRYIEEVLQDLSTMSSALSIDDIRVKLRGLEVVE